MIRIGLLSADSGSRFSQQFLDFEREMDVEIFIQNNVTRFNMGDCLQRLIDEHQIEAVICRNPLSSFVRQISPIPVLSISISEADIVRAVYSCAKPVQSFAYYIHETDDEKYGDIKQELERMTGCKVIMPKLKESESYVYDDLEQRYEMVKDCDLVVTGTTLLWEFFRNHGKNAVYVSADPYRIKECIINAKNAVEIQKKEKRQRRLAEWALDSTENCFILLEKDEIVMVNENLCRLLNMKRGELVNRQAQEFWGLHPFLQKVQNSQFSKIIDYQGIKYMPFLVEKDFTGNGENKTTVISIGNIESIESNEHSVRRELVREGFQAKYTFSKIISVCPQMDQLKDRAMKYAGSMANILVTGESGTGKEMLVQSIHNASQFAQGPFVAVNCTAIPESLIESELFGYAEGAFTGAKKGGKRGLFELSHNGTLFLDEIGEIPLTTQAKLLRCIQERSVTRVGAETPIPIRNRLICATNKDLMEQVKKGLFREDLYYRINVLRLQIPPLRERREDIGVLAQEFLNQAGIRPFGKFPRALFCRLMEYDWPGNVRELEAFIQRVAAVGCPLDMEDARLRELVEELHLSRPRQPGEGGTGFVRIAKGTMREMEDQILSQIYEDCGGNLQAVSRTLDLGYSTVWRKLSKHRYEGTEN